MTKDVDGVTIQQILLTNAFQEMKTIINNALNNIGYIIIITKKDLMYQI